MPIPLRIWLFSMFFAGVALSTFGQTTIWSDDFESYADNTTTAADNNTNDVGTDWSIEVGAASYFRVEADQVIGGFRSMVARNTGAGISKTWQTEVIDIIGYDNVALSMDYNESGDLEVTDDILIEYRLDGASWETFTNGSQSDDLPGGVEAATVAGLSGCTVELRVTVTTNSNYEYWFFDNVLVEGTIAGSNSCFTATTLSLSETGSGNTSTYTFGQSIPNDGSLDLDITSGAGVTITMADGDLSTATLAGSTFDGVAIASFTTQNSTTLAFNAPSTVTEGSTFSIVIAGLTNVGADNAYTALIEAANDQGGNNLSNYEYTIGPDPIWTEDFESYNDNETTAADNNTADVGVDWTIEPGAASFFRVESTYLIDGTRSMVTRNTGAGISKSWTSEVVDISAYDNILLSVEYTESGDLEATDDLLVEYRLDGGTWTQFPTNGYQSDDMFAPAIATASGLLGCTVEIQVTIATNSNYEYWSFDNVTVSSESAGSNACFTSASLALSETGISNTSTYTFTQTIPNNGSLDLDVTTGNSTTILVPDGDLSSATLAGSTVDGVAISSFTSQNSTTLVFNSPTTVAEGSTFDIVIAGITNVGTEDDYTASVQSTNDDGGVNHSNYEYTIGPDRIWFEDFESYNDDETIAVDNNTTDVGVDWTIEPGAASFFRVENTYLLDGSRTMVTRNTGAGISKSWTSEVVDISAYENVLLSLEYTETGDLEATDDILIEYRLDGGAWTQFATNGYTADDMSAPLTATTTGLLGCTAEIQVTIRTNSNYEYWSFDNITIASESAGSNACFTAASLALSETGLGNTSTYSFTQTIPNDGTLDLDVTSGNAITISLINSDLSSATLAGSTVDGVAVGSFTSQNANTLVFNSPTSVAEGSTFDIVIAGITNAGIDDDYTASVQATNDEGGFNHSNYEYTIGPDKIWFEDFESYNDDETIAVDKNTTDVGVDWTIEPGAASFFRVENTYLLDGSRTMVTRNTGTGISKSWTSEVIDISAYDNVLLSLEYIETGDLEASDEILVEYRLDGGTWTQFTTNGAQADDMTGPSTATTTGLLGCTVEIQVTCTTNSNYEYWSFDNVTVASESAGSNSCFSNASVLLSETGSGNVSDYTFTQTIVNDAGLDLNVTTGNSVTIAFPDGDLSTATLAGTSTFNGVAIASFTSQTSTSLIFNAPTNAAEGSTFDIVIAGITNAGIDDEYAASVRATNDEGGINHSNYKYTVGPDPIWSEDFETYSDNATVAADNNPTDIGVDWTIEPGAASFFRVENTYLLDGARTMVTRNTGAGISKSWTSEVVDISAYDNVLLSLEYIEWGDLEVTDDILIEYRLDGGTWTQFTTNGYTADDMSGPLTATTSGLLGCTVQIQVTCLTNSNYEYWSFDNVTISSESEPANSCFSNTSLVLTETGTGNVGTYTFSQTIVNDGSLDLNITTGNAITISLPDGDLNTATLSGSSVDGVAIGSFTSQNSTTLIFNSPTSIAEGSSFDIVIAGITNVGTDDEYTASVQAINDEGGVNHSNYQYTIGPDFIWMEDFETYSDDATTAIDNNTNDVGVDWEIEPGAASFFRVENTYLLDGARTMVTRNTGAGISKSWTSEVIDISAYDNVLLSVEYTEWGDLEATDDILIEYRLDGGTWTQFTTNGYTADDMSAPKIATSTGILGCTVELQVTCLTNSNYEYWSFDNVSVSSEAAPTNSCFSNPVLALSETGASQTGSYTFTQTIDNDGALDLDITSGNAITISLPDGDLSSATVSGTTVDGVAVASFTSQSSTTLIFDSPTSVAEGATFDIVIAGVTNVGTDADYTASIQATNDEGGFNHSNYDYTIGPDLIWTEDFEAYNDDATSALDINTNDAGVDWTIESGAASFFRVENTYLLDGARTLVTRNTGTNNPIAWQSEAIDISAFDNVLLSVEYTESGDLEVTDYIDIDYRIDGSSWEDFSANGYQADDMSAPATATQSGLLGCTVEIRVTLQTDSNYEYWSVDNITVSTESEATNSCFSSPFLGLTDDSPSAVTNYTYTQTIENNATYDMDITTGSAITISAPDGDLSSVTLAGSSVDGVAIASFTSQSSTQLVFNSPTTISEGVQFDIVLADVTNDAVVGLKGSTILANNDAGGINHYTFQYNMSPTTLYARNSGAWSNEDTWSTTGVGSAKCDCKPGTLSDVLIDGFDVTMSTTNATISDLTVQNQNMAADASLAISGGMNLTVTNDANFAIDDPAENTTLTLATDNTQFNVGGDLNFTTTSGNNLQLHIDDASQVNVTGNFNANHNAGNELQVYLNNNSGTAGQLNVTGNWNLTQTGGNDILINMDENSQVSVNNLTMTLSGGDDILFYLGNNSTSTAILNVSGNLTLDHDGNTGGDDMSLILQDDSQADITGNFHIDTDFPAAANLGFARLNDNAIMTVSGDVEFTAAANGNSELEMNNDSELRLAGDFTRNGGFGILDGNDNSTVQFNGSTASQTFAQTSGTGSDNFTYANVQMNNSFSTAPQVSLDGDVTLTGTLTLTDGIVSSGANTLIVSSTSNTAITGHSAGSFINGNLRKGIATNTDTYPLPVGTGNTAANYQLADFVNNSLAGVTALDVSVATITESGNNVDSNLVPANVSDRGAAIVNIHSDAEWDINPVGTVSGGDYGIRLYVANIAGLGSASDNDFTVLKRPSGSTDYADWNMFYPSTSIPDFDDPGRVYTSGNGYAERLGYTTFSGFAIGETNDSPLPIELLDFTVELKDGTVLIQWRTVSEKDNEYFTLEKSADGVNYIEVQRTPGAGNSDEILAYQATDNQPYYGVSYYRLKQTDFDGAFEYFGPRVISNSNFSSNANYTFYPNPTDGIVVVKGELQLEGTYSVYDIRGQEVRNGNLQEHLTISVTDLPEGIYLIKIVTDLDEQIFKILKE